MKKEQKLHCEKLNALYKKIEAGDTKTMSGLMRYLIFDSSNAMRTYLDTSNVDPETKYLADKKFIKNLSHIFIDLFKYKV